MLDELLNREDVSLFIREIETNERYFSKEISNEVDSIYISNELALFVFYDALYKYKIIVDDEYLFDEYLEQLQKLYRKLNDFVNIRIGINKLICTMLSIKFNINDYNDSENRKKIITHVYNQYIINGYFIHGFNSSYIDNIKESGFMPERYFNYYDRFIKMNEIFKKYNINNVIDKDFLNRKVYFTDDFVKGCYYSMYAPMFFFKFLINNVLNKNKIDEYLIGDYSLINSALKKYMSNNLFHEKDKKYILELVKDEWNLLHKYNNKISLLFIKRDKLIDNELSLDDFINDDSDIFDIVDRLLNSKYNNIGYEKFISNSDFDIVFIDGYYNEKNEKKKREDELYRLKEEEIGTEFLNMYGKASVFILIGSILITLGVIITIIMFMLGGK